MEIQQMRMPDKIKYVQDTLYVISGKWKLPILMTMYDGNLRFMEIQKSISTISPRILSKELKELEANQLITRTVHEDANIVIEYSLTEYSKTLKKVVDTMVTWGNNHRKKISRK